MQETRIHPEKITHPVQLMAAWFVMLVLLVGVLLTAATKIDQPTWAAGFLVISSVVLSVLVMLAVFLMLTKFRPHLQGPKEYAEWLKDEHRREKESLPELEIHDIPELQPQVATVPMSADIDILLLRQIMTHPVHVSYLRNVHKLLSALRELGFKVEVYEGVGSSMKRLEFNSADEHRAIWIGSRVSPRVASLVLKTAISFWPHLCYIHLSSDTTARPPDSIQDEIYLGGSTRAAQKYGLESWSKEEILELPDNMKIEDFHKTIRSKYAKQDSSAELEKKCH